MSPARATFNRAMRRHEARARRMGLSSVADEVAIDRAQAGHGGRLAVIAGDRRAEATEVTCPTGRFLFLRAAEAVERLLAAEGPK